MAATRMQGAAVTVNLATGTRGGGGAAGERPEMRGLGAAAACRGGRAPGRARGAEHKATKAVQLISMDGQPCCFLVGGGCRQATGRGGLAMVLREEGEVAAGLKQQGGTGAKQRGRGGSSGARAPNEKDKRGGGDPGSRGHARGWQLRFFFNTQLSTCNMNTKHFVLAWQLSTCNPAGKYYSLRPKILVIKMDKKGCI